VRCRKKFLLTLAIGDQTGAMAVLVDEVAKLQTIFYSVTYLSTRVYHSECETVPRPSYILLDFLGDGNPVYVGNADSNYSDINKAMISSTNFLREGVRNGFRDQVNS
jgi:hypothetical protein